MKKLIINFEDDSLLEKALEKIKTHISNGITKKEFQVNKTKVSFSVETIVPPRRIRMSINELNQVLSNSTGQDIDVRNLKSLNLNLEVHYQVRYNGIDVYLYLNEINGEKVLESDPRHNIFDENDEYFYELGNYVLEYYDYAIDALNSPDSMLEQFFDDELNELFTSKGFTIKTKGYEGKDS
jgi:hypothetical protein